MLVAGVGKSSCNFPNPRYYNFLFLINVNFDRKEWVVVLQHFVKDSTLQILVPWF
jgi:hypothetical protein